MPTNFAPHSLLQQDILEAMQAQESEESDSAEQTSSQASTQPKTYQQTAFTNIEKDPYSLSSDPNARTQSYSTFQTDFKGYNRNKNSVKSTEKPNKDIKQEI